MIKALIKSGADVNAEYHLGGTPLDLAKTAGHTGSAEVIRNAGGTGRGRFPRLWRRPRL